MTQQDINKRFPNSRQRRVKKFTLLDLHDDPEFTRRKRKDLSLIFVGGLMIAILIVIGFIVSFADAIDRWFNF